MMLFIEYIFILQGHSCLDPLDTNRHTCQISYRFASYHHRPHSHHAHYTEVAARQLGACAHTSRYTSHGNKNSLDLDKNHATFILFQAGGGQNNSHIDKMSKLWNTAIEFMIEIQPQ